MIPRTCLTIILCVLIAAIPVRAQTQDETDIKRGEYVFRISGCGHCHTAEDGEPLAGGRGLETPFGTFYTPNISSHKTAGIGAWSAEDLQRALHQGVSPNGDDYYPAFPYTSYTGMYSEDIRVLHAYLLSLPASEQPNREHELAWYLPSRIAATAWKWLFFSAGEFQQRADRDAQWNRGAYIAEALGHCGECHTPRNPLGAMQTERAYSGNPQGPEDELVPNITPHDPTGIGEWGRDDLHTFLQFGELPDGEYTAGSMEPVIEGTHHLTPSDREALIDYLRALAPIENRLSK
jgi:mono/diheme cytochrome c family protein